MQIRLKLNIALFICCACALSACDSNNPPSFEEEEILEAQERLDTTIIEEEKRPFAMVYQQMVLALASGNVESLNSMIHGSYGCYLIESPGAIPTFTKINNLEILFSKADQPILNFGNLAMSTALQNESLPVIDCDSPDGFYSKNGTFVEDVNALEKGEIWKHIGLSDEDQQSISKSSITVSKTVVNTAGFTAYFSFIDEVWYITFIDIRVPCTA